MSTWHRGLLAALIVATLALRLTGWDRGSTDDGRFLQYHPDERTLIGAALALDDALDPPLTAYGTFPMYVGRIVLASISWVAPERFELNASAMDQARGRRIAVVTLRVVAVVLSMATLLIVWFSARSVWGASTALLAIGLTGAAPLAIQQAHFYTVDGVFALLSMASLALVLRLDSHRDLSSYLLAGVLIGTAAATRLNGLLTAVVLVASNVTASSLRTGPQARWRQLAGRLWTPGLWLAGLTTVAVLLLWQPFLLFHPERMTTALNTNDFAYSVAIARGQILRPWSLADMHTIPWVHYWVALFPRGVGWPLTLLLAAGWLRAVVFGDRKSRLVALWCALVFFSVGGLHTKHVRYLLPLLAPLGMLAAVLLMDLCTRRRWKPWAVVAAVVCGVSSWTYGIAFSRIYQVEDARTTAGRWIDQHIPKGSSVGVERGGFSMRGTFTDPDLREHDLNTTTVFATRGYLSCGAAAEYLAGRMEWVDWIAITDVNRYRQYTAAPDTYPVLASFYEALLAEDLGFETVQRFKVYPEVAGWTFHDDDAEPSFLGFDHPAVYVLRSMPDRNARLATWRRAASAMPACPDSHLTAIVSHMGAADFDGAQTALASLRQITPPLASLLAVMVHERQGESEAARAEMAQFSQGVNDKSLAASLLPWASAASLTNVGLLEEAVRVLELGWRRRDGLAGVDREIMAKSYLYIAARANEVGRVDLQERVHLMAADLWEAPLTLNHAASLIEARGDWPTALALLTRSLELDANQISIHLRAAVAARAAGLDDRALHHVQQVFELASHPGATISTEDVDTAAEILQAVDEAAKARSYLQGLIDTLPDGQLRDALSTSQISTSLAAP